MMKNNHSALSWQGLALLLGLMGMLMLSLSPAFAAPMQNDPEGFQGIPWGTLLKNVQNLVLVDTWEHIEEYQFKGGPPPLGEAPVESVKLSTIEGQFARAMIRYQGEKTHGRIMAYLQAQFGTIQRIPGSMVRGLNQQFNWRGSETEINLTYRAMGEQGYVFIESRTLAARFNDTLPDHSF